MAAGWQPVFQRLLGGLVHDLRGRATALGGLGRLLADDDAGREWFLEHFTGELDRFQTSVELLSLLRSDPSREPEPLSVGDALPALLELWSRGDGRPLPSELKVDPDAPPVRVRWPAFNRAFLILLDEAEARARASGASRLEVLVEAGQGETGLTIAWDQGSASGVEDQSPEGPSPALRDLFLAVGGRLAESVEASALTARFPALG